MQGPIVQQSGYIGELLEEPMLALLLCLPPAEAARIKGIRIVQTTQEAYGKVINISGGTDVNFVSNTVTSPTGTETVTLTETNALLHGGGALSTLPKNTSGLTLTLYSSSNEVVDSFEGSLSPDGTARFKAGLGGTDLELLSSELYALAGGGYELSVNLSGADTYQIAYGDLELRETVQTCDKSGCTSTVKSSTSEVYWDEVGAVWEAPLMLRHVGVPAISATTYDRAGKKLDTADVVTWPNFVDDWQGEMALATDEDPLTGVVIDNPIFVPGNNVPSNVLGLTVFSQGWSNAGAVPASAEVKLDNGSTLQIPATSYQVATVQTLSTAWTSAVRSSKETPRVKVSLNGGTLLLNDNASISLSDLSSPVCIKGGCLSLHAGPKDWELALTGYAGTVGELPTSTKVTLTLVDSYGNKLYSEAVSASYDPEVSVFFANAITVTEDPYGMDLSGKVSLLGTPGKNGKASTLSKGKFYGRFEVNEDGSLGLGSADKSAMVPRGDILIGGEPIGFELSDTNGDGIISGPPQVLQMTNGNGKGTRDVATVNTGKPGLL